MRKPRIQPDHHWNAETIGLVGDVSKAVLGKGDLLVALRILSATLHEWEADVVYARQMAMLGDEDATLSDEKKGRILQKIYAAIEGTQS